MKNYIIRVELKCSALSVNALNALTEECRVSDTQFLGMGFNEDEIVFSWESKPLMIHIKRFKSLEEGLAVIANS